MGLQIRRVGLPIKYLAIAASAIFVITSVQHGHRVDAVTSLPAPSLVSPQDNVTIRGKSYVQSWNNVDGAVKYRYESYNDITEKDKRTSVVYDTTSKVSSNVPDGSVYWWRVRAIDSTGVEGTWSHLWKITIDNTAPQAPILTGDATRYVQSGSVIRTWQKSSSPDVKEYNYRSYYTESDAQNLPNTAKHYASLTYSSGKGLYSITSQTGANERTFWYRVAAIDYAGNKTWSNEIYRVIVDNTAPIAPTLAIDGIASGDTTNTTSATVHWSTPSTDVASYEYRYRTDADSNWHTGTTTDMQATQSLDTDTTYHMQVRATDLAGNVGDWSPEFVLTRDATPPVVVAAAGSWSANTTQPNVTVTGESADVTYQWSVPADVQVSSTTIAEPQFTVPADISDTYTLSLTVTDAAGNQTIVPLDITYTYVAPSTSKDPTPTSTGDTTYNEDTGGSSNYADEVTSQPDRKDTVQPELHTDNSASIHAESTNKAQLISNGAESSQQLEDGAEVLSDSTLNDASQVAGTEYGVIDSHNASIVKNTSDVPFYASNFFTTTWGIAALAGASVILSGGIWWLLVIRRRRKDRTQAT